MYYYIDIDQTITQNVHLTNYANAQPNYQNIKKVNDLYDNGNTIVMWTARGSLSNINWFEITHAQLTKWGVKFHELRMGKPAYDVLIDDKAFNSVHDWNNDLFINSKEPIYNTHHTLPNDDIIGHTSRCLIIAEVGQNHQGDLNIAKKYIKECHEAGADIVKFQKSDLTSKFNKKALDKEYDSVNSYGKTYGEHKEFLEFNKDQYIELQNYAKEVGIIFTASGMDINSFDFLNSIDCPILKIGSGDTNNLELLKHVAQYNKPLILSTGMNDMSSVIKSVNTLLDNGANILYLMQCTSSYPLNDNDVDLNIMNTYREYFGNKVLVGYSGHDKGVEITLGSVGMGATIIEKHVTFDKSWKGSDHICSLDMSELTYLCSSIRRIENARGSSHKVVKECEQPCINKLGKSLVLTKDMTKHSIISNEDLTTKVAVPIGINPNKLYDIIGKQLLVDKKIDDALLESDLQ